MFDRIGIRRLDDGAYPRRVRLQVQATLETIKGYKDFVRDNPMSDKFEVLGFNHLELWCSDAMAAWKAFSLGLGMPRIARSELSTGNTRFSSHVIGSGTVKLAFTAPYGYYTAENTEPSHPGALDFDPDSALNFVQKHGTAVRTVGITVANATEAFEVSVRNGATPVNPPKFIQDQNGAAEIAEVSLYGDTVIRWVSYPTENAYSGIFLPGYQDTVDSMPEGFGISRIDHVVGNVRNILPQANAMIAMTGFHEFAEFTSEDVGTVESGLNSLVLANNLENVLLPINEPVEGRRQSQIETYLQHNKGPGVQHVALKTDDIFTTIERMRERGEEWGFELMRRPSDQYYHELPARLGEALSPDDYQWIEKLGLLADKDDQGILLQIFTTPVTHRPTLFLEIIQRIGCEIEAPNGQLEQKGGCGGFGKGNFKELFKSIEDYEKKFVK
uniref:4-hydroxyphenylpyruvate dioxygenase n=1 Tax=Amorphochlora amoebiformis TaxID=1561963 RepID=A0A7S0D3B1_9EUKA